MKTVYSIFSMCFSGLLVLNGCSTPGSPAAGNINSGTINHIYTSRELKMRPPSCLYTLSQSEIVAGEYADINLPTEKGHRITSAFVPEPLKVEVGDEVQLSSVKCEKGAVPQVVQILKRRH
ncbi:hypothetical protein ABC383_06035 [Noviherbaspirillum sp. 1P10PC]|uniref:hypothetical protein n=1 Tax=Noviherbaspirillum sp. 1P10PC TaxID=3132292 RepID=UPI0039A095EE